jgi:competence protein ComEA
VEPSSAPWRVIETPEPPAPATGTPPRGRPWLAIGAAGTAAVVIAAALLLAARSDPVVGVEGAARLDAGSVGQGGPTSTGPAPGRQEIVVEVGGAVVRPGVYRLPPGSRVGDAIAAAGGYGSRVDATASDLALNLAARLADGQEIHVPARGETAPPGPAATGTGAARASPGGSTGPVDLNHASATELDALPGIGPATAAKIIAAREERPFASLDDLGARKVLGAVTLDKIRALATVRP